MSAKRTLVSVPVLLMIAALFAPIGVRAIEDTDPPATTITRIGTTPATSVTNFILTSDELATFECNLDGSGFTACLTNFTTPYLSEGEHVLAVRAIDVAYNVDPSPAVEIWTVDSAPPETYLDSTPGRLTSAVVGHFTFSAVDISPVVFECSVDEAAYAPCTSPYDSATLNVGSHSFAVRAVDAGGRTDIRPATYWWMITGDQGGLPTTDRTTGVWTTITLLLAGLSAAAVGVRLSR